MTLSTCSGKAPSSGIIPWADGLINLGVQATLPSTLYVIKSQISNNLQLNVKFYLDCRICRVLIVIKGRPACQPWVASVSRSYVPTPNRQSNHGEPSLGGCIAHRYSHATEHLRTSDDHHFRRSSRGGSR